MAKASLRRAAALVLVAVLLTACIAPTAPAPAGDDGLEIAILVPSAGKDTESLVVQLAAADGAPITDATVAVEGDMNHAGMIPVIGAAVTDDADGSADGRYTIPFGFTMLGDWILTVNVTLADGSTVTRAINAQVREDEVTIAGAPEAHDHEDAHMDDHEHEDAHMDDHDHDHMDAGKHAEALHVHDVRARPAPLVGGNAAVYFMLHNPTDAPNTLIGGATDAAARVEIHETVQEGDVMRMRQLVDGLRVEAGQTVVLEPGGLHVMLVELVNPLEVGDEFELTLHFDNGEELVLLTPVMPIEGSTGRHQH